MRGTCWVRCGSTPPRSWVLQPAAVWQNQRTEREVVWVGGGSANGVRWCASTLSRPNLVAAWREATVFTDAERAALELTEQGTRIADAAGGVTDEAWANAVKHYDEDQLAALVCLIAFMNTVNRVNVIVRQPAGDYQPGQFG